MLWVAGRGSGPAPFERGLAMDGKAGLRKRLRAARPAHVAALPEATRALLFLRPPRAILDRVPAAAIVGLYAESPEEAPASSYARWFFEAGHPIALPWFGDRGAEMGFRRWDNPYDSEALVPGPWGVRQPGDEAARWNP